MRKKLVNKKATKKFAKKCYFCNENNYVSLQCHRIIFGENNGTYEDKNVLVVCGNCHAKIHAGIIKIDRKYLSTSGSWILHYWIDDQEFWN